MSNEPYIRIVEIPRERKRSRMERYAYVGAVTGAIGFGVLVGATTMPILAVPAALSGTVQGMILGAGVGAVTNAFRWAFGFSKNTREELMLIIPMRRNIPQPRVRTVNSRVSIRANLMPEAVTFWQAPDIEGAGIPVFASAEGCYKRGKGQTLTHLPDYIEWSIRNHLNGSLNGISIHVMGQRYEKIVTPEYKLEATYFERAIFFSQRQNPQDKPVFFFAMYVQEFEKDCGIRRNDGRVYISYLDSTAHYKRLADEMVSIKRLIVVSYMEYVAALGFHSVHIWSCAPSDDQGYYIFPCGKRDRILADEELAAWYLKTCKEGGWEDVEYKKNFELVDKNAFEYPLFPHDIKLTASVAFRQDRGTASTVVRANIFKIGLTKCLWYPKYHEIVKLFWNNVDRGDIVKNSFADAVMAAKSTVSLVSRAKLPDEATNRGLLRNPEW